jgi:putative membrane protein
MHVLAPLLADTNGWHHGHWWIVFPILWLLLIALAIALCLQRRGPHDGDPAKRILGERFARGEINADEYRERLAQLQ